jgi:hypothetical protein
MTDEHKLDQLRYLQHVSDTARRWRAKRDRTIQMFYVQGDGSLSELAGAAGITKRRAHQIVRGAARNLGAMFLNPPNRVQVPAKRK